MGYLLKASLTQADEILLLAFNRAAADELGARIQDRLGATVRVGTFHSVGYEIIGAATGARPALCRGAEDSGAANEHLQAIIKRLCARDGRFAAAYIRLNAYHRSAYLPHWVFASMDEYHRYLRRVELRALSGDRMKSLEECAIANWLTLNGIDFHYERPYEHRAAISGRRQYQPDFYLPDHGIYIEHFGVSRDGQVAPRVDRDRYLDGMTWKRQLHREHGTTLIETASRMHAEGVLLETLERKLRAHGIVPAPLDPEQVLEELNKLGAPDTTAELIGTLMRLAKGVGLSPEDLRARAREGIDHSRSAAFLDVYEAFLGAYEQ